MSRMQVRHFRPADARPLVELSRSGARGEADFVLHPLWESEEELYGDFERHGIAPEEHLIVADNGDDRVLGVSGYLRFAGDETAALIPPVVARAERGKGVGGELLRRALGRGTELGVKLATAALGSRNRSGYALLAAYGFRPRRQHFFMRLAGELAPIGPLPAGVSCEPAQIDDLAAMHELYAEAGFPTRSPEAMRRAFEDRRHAHAVARREGRVVAFVELDHYWPKRVWVAFVGVAAPLRDRGVGTALVRSALAREFEQGATSALLLLSPANRAGVRAYEKAGFRRHRLIDVLDKGL